MRVREKKIQNFTFVKRAINQLNDGEDDVERIHLKHSGLIDALHVYYSKSVVSPYEAVWDMIKKGIIIAEMVDDGLFIYRPDARSKIDSDRILKSADISFKGEEIEGETCKKKVMRQLSALFDYSEFSCSFGHCLDFEVYDQKSETKGHFFVNASFNKAKNEFVIHLDTGVKRFGSFIFLLDAGNGLGSEHMIMLCKRAVRQTTPLYEFDEKNREAAEKVIDIITNKKGKSGFDRSDAEGVIVAYAEDFDENNCIVKKRFLEIVRKKMTVAVNGGTIATVMRYFTFVDKPLLKHVKIHPAPGLDGDGLDGYQLTKYALDLIAHTVEEVTVSGDVAEPYDLVVKMREILQKKRQSEKTLDEAVAIEESTRNSVGLLEEELSRLQDRLETHRAHLEKTVQRRKQIECDIKQQDALIYAMHDIE